MRLYTVLWIAVAAVFGLTLVLDLTQQKAVSKDKVTIAFASMWAPGEPMMKGYEKLFRRFEQEYPQYEVEPRWDGRWVLAALRPRLLTGTNIPDIVNTDRDALIVLVKAGYAAALDEVVDRIAYPHDRFEPAAPDKRLRDAFLPKILERCHYETGDEHSAGLYMLPAGIWSGFIFFNRLHYEKLGLQIPATWSHFLANCQMIKEQLKDEGIAPLAADKDSYSQLWSQFLLNRTLGEQVVQHSVEGTGPRFDTDPRYRAVFQAIRAMHQDGFFMYSWRSSKWPDAQRAWTQGKATHLICGSYLIRETLEYQPDPAVFQLGAFPVPILDAIEWGDMEPVPLGDPTGVTATIAGHALMQEAPNRAAAIELLAFLARKESAAVLSAVGKEIPPIAGAPFPAELIEIQDLFQTAQTVYKTGFHIYAPLWNKYQWKDLYRAFFMGEKPEHEGYLTVDAFLEKLQERTDAYRAAGGELAADARVAP